MATLQAGDPVEMEAVPRTSLSPHPSQPAHFIVEVAPGYRMVADGDITAVWNCPGRRGELADKIR